MSWLEGSCHDKTEEIKEHCINVEGWCRRIMKLAAMFLVIGRAQHDSSHRRTWASMIQLMSWELLRKTATDAYVTYHSHINTVICRFMWDCDAWPHFWIWLHIMVDSILPLSLRTALQTDFQLLQLCFNYCVFQEVSQRLEVADVTICFR
jgi:hypothetical protein